MPLPEEIFGLNPDPKKLWPFFHVQDQKAPGVDGGSNIAGDNERTFNEIVYSNMPALQIAPGLNGIFMPEGNYYVEACAPMRATSGADISKTRLYIKDYEDTTFLQVGPNNMCIDDQNSNLCFVEGKITILPGMSGIKLVHFISLLKSTSGLGVATGQSPHEVYADLKIWGLP